MIMQMMGNRKYVVDLVLVPFYSVRSVYSVVLPCKFNHGIHGKHGEDTE